MPTRRGTLAQREHHGDAISRAGDCVGKAPRCRRNKAYFFYPETIRLFRGSGACCLAAVIATRPSAPYYGTGRLQDARLLPTHHHGPTLGSPVSRRQPRFDLLSSATAHVRLAHQESAVYLGPQTRMSLAPDPPQCLSAPVVYVELPTCGEARVASRRGRDLAARRPNGEHPFVMKVWPPPITVPHMSRPQVRPTVIARQCTGKQTRHAALSFCHHQHPQTGRRISQTSRRVFSNLIFPTAVPIISKML